MITNYIFQRQVALLAHYEFVLDWTHEGETLPLIAVVAVSHRDGVVTIVDMAVEGDLPEGFADTWNADEAIKHIKHELGEELARLETN